jgi:PAS domain S-box-containing protein
MAVEVTAQVQANEKLSALNAQLLEAREASESERETLNQFLQQAPVGVCVLSGPKLVYQFINPGYQALLPGRDLQNRPIFEALPEIVGTSAEQMLLDVYQKGETFNLSELLIPLAKEEDGVLENRYFTFIYTPWRNKTGKINGILVFVHDVTEQVGVHKKIERAEANLRLATEAANLATWYINAETFELFPSPRLMELFGYEPHETMPYEAAVRQIADSHRDKVIEAVNAAVNKGESYNLEYPIIGFNDQQTRWVRAIGKLFEATAGEPAHFSGTIVEITKEKEQEQLKNDFISMVSHELKTPLTSLKGYLQMLTMKASKSEDEFAVNTLSRAGKQIEKMTKMINGFLNVARLEAGSIYIDTQIFDMATLVKESEAESLISITSHSIIYAPVEETIVKADMDKIGQVIHNLISNAVKYSPPGSTVRVACETIDGHARVCVQDEGMGIKPKDMKQLFDRFYRVENAETKSIGGFGIGLYLCAEIIRRHDGKIWVESEPGKGSTFFFSIPTHLTRD